MKPFRHSALNWVGVLVLTLLVAAAIQPAEARPRHHCRPTVPHGCPNQKPSPVKISKETDSTSPKLLEPVLSGRPTTINAGVIPPEDQPHGKPAGKHKHHPIKITKAVDSGSPTLWRTVH